VIAPEPGGIHPDEVVGSQIVEVHSVAEHMVGDDEDAVDDGDPGSFQSATLADTSELRATKPGDRAVENRDMSMPISDASTPAEPSPTCNRLQVVCLVRTASRPRSPQRDQRRQLVRLLRISARGEGMVQNRPRSASASDFTFGMRLPIASFARRSASVSPPTSASNMVRPETPSSSATRSRA